MKDPEAPAHEFLKTHAIAGKTSARVVKMIVASMLRDGWRGAAITVAVHGSDKYILDGHHRVFAARRANVPVRYRVVSETELERFGYESIEQVIQAHAEAGFNRIHLR
jgi:hypothetical protein